MLICLQSSLEYSEKAIFPRNGARKMEPLKDLKVESFSDEEMIVESFCAAPPEGEETHSFQTDNISKILLKITGCLMFVKIFLLPDRDDPK